MAMLRTGLLYDPNRLFAAGRAGRIRACLTGEIVGIPSPVGEGRRMAYDLIIANGTVVSAEGTQKADVAVRGERIAAVGPGLAAKAGCGQGRRRGRQVRHARRPRRSRPPRTAILRHRFQRHLADRHPGGGPRRRHHRHRLRHSLRRAIAAGRLRRLAGAGQAESVHRLRLSHGHHQLGPPRPRDGEDGQAGLPDVQGVHDLRGRGLAVRRPGHFQRPGELQEARRHVARPRRDRPACSTN